MKPSYLLFAMFILGFGLAGCKNESATEGAPPQYNPPQDIRAIVPLAINQEAHYRLIRTDFTGERETTLVTRRIPDTVIVDSISWYRLEGSFGLLLDNPLLRTDSVSFIDYVCYYCLRPTNVQASGWRPFYLLTAPIVKGHEWKMAPWDSTGQGYFGTLRIANADTTIFVAGRIYQHAIVVEFVQDRFLGEDYFVLVPGIGIVYEVSSGIDTGSQLELIDHN